MPLPLIIRTPAVVIKRNAAYLKSIIAEAIEEGRDVVVLDMSETDYIDLSTWVRWCSRTTAQRGAGPPSPGSVPRLKCGTYTSAAGRDRPVRVAAR